jgi:gamma-glutamylcysteine synthetase
MSLTMTTKHTPGPWRHICQADWPHTQEVYVTAQNWGVIATARVDSSMPHMVEQQRANLRLISAAPELLEALQAVAAGLDTLENRAKTRAAIAKATGA